MTAEFLGDIVQDHISGLREGRTMEFEGMVVNLNAASKSPDFGRVLKGMAGMGFALIIPLLSKESSQLPRLADLIQDRNQTHLVVDPNLSQVLPNGVNHSDGPTCEDGGGEYQVGTRAVLHDGGVCTCVQFGPVATWTDCDNTQNKRGGETVLLVIGGVVVGVLAILTLSSFSNPSDFS
jgi:hypothetical protein